MQRFVVPVYQRPYSWDEDQCVQLWDDVLAVGRRPSDTHFTGSVVWIQDGTMSPNGVTPLLVIDGQQRITTVVLMLIALAEYARDHQKEQLHFTYEQIVNSNCIVMTFQKGDDRYKLTLSQGDRPTLNSIIDHLLDPNAPLIEESSRLVSNLEFFRNRLEGLSDVNEVWDGLQRLEVVSISLTQGQDNPQLIFESMNSTGKDLSSADLIRNFVLMDLPLEEQEKLYKNHWRRIEETLGADSYDTVFDDFIRNYLTVIFAPEPLAKRDVYQTFKRHARNDGYTRDDRMVELLSELERYARYYSAITNGTEKNPRLKEVFADIARLDTSMLNPLLMSLYADYEAEAFSEDDFVSMLRTSESYIFRRNVCDCASNSLSNFFPALIARLNRVQDEGGNYREAFESFLLNEAGTSRRFPSDAEFARELQARDSYHFKKSFYMLAKLENSYHPKDPRDFANGNYTIEHIMPQNALAHEEWRSMLGPNYEEDFEDCLNNIGNLTLTAYNSELSDALFEKKKERAVGGFDNEYITISSALRDAESWTRASIEDRGRSLVKRALSVWGIPQVSDEIRTRYLPEKKSKKTRAVRFAELVASGWIKPGTKLTHGDTAFESEATVTATGTIRLENSEELTSPSQAAKRTVAMHGGIGNRNGWSFWRTPDGRLLDDVRKEYVSRGKGSVTADKGWFRSNFWDGFYDYCSSDPDFVGTFGDLSNRQTTNEWWISFGVGHSGYGINAQLMGRDGFIGAELYCAKRELYLPLLSHQDEANAMLEGLTGEVHWDEADEDKTSRHLIAKKAVDFDNDSWDEMYEWLAEWLCRLKAVASKFLG